MSTDNVELMLILKYGSLADAFHAWLTIHEANINRSFTTEEDDYLGKHAKKLYPNLNLKRITDYRKGWLYGKIMLI